MTKYFVDYGNYHIESDSSEIFIRKEHNGEVYDICNFSCDETNFPLDEANALCKALNESIAK
jgi:hypothetical protein